MENMAETIQNTSTEGEQGQISALNEQPRILDKERELAEKFHLELSKIKLLTKIAGEIVDEYGEGAKKLMAFMAGEGEKEDDDECQNVLAAFRGIISSIAAGEKFIRPEEKSTRQAIDEQTKAKLIAYFRKLSPQTKIAIGVFSEIEGLEGINFEHLIPRDEKLVTQIYDDIENACLNSEKDSSSVDAWLRGVWATCKMILANM